MGRYHRVRVHRVVVARRDDAPYRRVEPLGGQVAPPLHLRGDLAVEQPVQRSFIARETGQLAGLHPDRIEPGLAEVAAEPSPLRFGDGYLLAADPGPQGAVLGEHRDDGLAREVAAQDDHVRLVDLGRGQELAKADLRAVQVGGEVDAQLALFRALGLTPHEGYSGGSSCMAMLRSSESRCLRTCRAIT